MIAITVRELGGDAGEPFLLWAMAKTTTVGATFESVFDIAGAPANQLDEIRLRLTNVRSDQGNQWFRR